MEKHDIEELARRLVAHRAPSRVGAAVPPGVYAVFLDRLGLLPGFLTGEGSLLYIGMTADRTGERNHFEHANSGFSSPRRSLGALLKAQLHLRAIPRSRGVSSSNWTNYRFTDEGEAALTLWMRKNLSMSHVSLSGSKAEIERVEKQLIAYLKPPLNLKDNPGGSARSQLEALRKACREEARAASLGKR
jgi:hypothetical protein